MFHRGECTAQIDIPDLNRKLKQYLPANIFADAPSIKPRPPFIISFKLIPEGILQHATRWLQFIINKQIIIFVFSFFALLHFAVLITQPLDKITPLTGNTGAYFLFLFVLSFLIHELGHASACRRFGQKHGAIGFGIYVMFPAFYADVTNAWKLDRRKRAVIDLAGLYFQAIFLIVIDVIFLYSNSNTMLYLTIAVSLTMLHTLNPFFKFDGYWLLSDLSGISNLHEKVRITIYYYSRAFFRINNKHSKPVSNPIVYTYTLLMLCFTVLMVSIISSALGQYSQRLPTELSSWIQEFYQVKGFKECFFVIVGLLQLLFFPFLMLLGLCFYSFKMYRSFLVPIENK
jgi:putative peptide zinc metalloprotease protein